MRLIVLVSQSPLMMVARPTLPAQSVSEFIALARQQPGKLSYGSYGVGSINQFAAELFNLMAQTQTNHVPYRGSAPALADLMSGQIDYMFDGVSTSTGHVRAGTIRLLGIASLSRTPVMPDVPTIAEMPRRCPASTCRCGSVCSRRPEHDPKPIVDASSTRATNIGPRACRT